MTKRTSNGKSRQPKKKPASLPDKSSIEPAANEKRPGDKVGFLTFFIMWAKVMGWKVPRLHVRICLWLETSASRIRVLKVFRGAAKSTLYAIYKAWQLYCDRTHRSLVWSEDSKLATKMTRDALAVLRRHPLCKGMLPPAPGMQEFWVTGATDWRNPSMAAHGVLSNATGSRANDVDFDDIEVPKNIRTKEAREKLRDRISESTHILLPHGRKTYIGTPHTHDTIYDEQVRGGAEELKIPLFEHMVRYEDPPALGASMSSLKRIDYASAAPTTLTWNVGDRIFNSVPSVGNPKGWLRTVAGTEGTLNGGATTGTMTIGLPTLTVSSATGISRGDYLSVAGAIVKSEVLAISGTTVTLASNATASVAGVAVAYVAGTWVSEGNL